MQRMRHAGFPVIQETMLMKGGMTVRGRQSASLDRKKFFGDPVLVATIVLLTVFLVLFILYPLATLLVDSVLVIETRGVKIRNQRSNRIEVSAPMLSGLTVNGAADFNSDRIVTDDFTCNINGAGDVYINSLEAKDVSVEVNGAGDLDIEHFRCEEANVEINGAGDLAVEDLDCNNIRIEVNGAGDVSLSGKARTARVDITGAGDVKASSLECDDFVKTVNGKIRSK